MRRVGVLICARRPVILCGIAGILSAEDDFVIVGTCRHGAAAVAAIRHLQPEITLLDTAVLGPSAPQIVQAINSEQLPTRVVVFASTTDNFSLLNALAQGAYGVISDDITPRALIRSLRHIAAGEVSFSYDGYDNGPVKRIGSPGLAGLTNREREIASLVSTGLSNKEIGRQLNLKEGTIKVHLHSVFQKLAIRNRTVLASASLLQSALANSRQENVSAKEASD